MHACGWIYGYHSYGWGNGPATAQANSSTTEHHERGRYLVKIAECHNGYTPGYAETGGKVPEKEWLTGNSMGW